jgi:hypothetical protein
MRGRWTRALESADVFIAECEAGSPHVMEAWAREVRASLLTANGDLDRAIRDQLRSFELSQAGHDPIGRLGGCALTAALLAECREPDEARAYAVGIPSLVRELGIHGALTPLLPFADALGIADDLRDAVAAGAGPPLPFWRRVVELGLAGELDAAADVMEAAGTPTVEATLRRHAGFRLLATRRTADARIELERALAFYRTVDASFYIAQIEGALAELQSASA